VRALSSFFGILASMATIGAMAVRVWWSKPRPTPQDTMPDDPPKAPPWLRKLAKVWLYVVAIGATAAVIIVAVAFVVRIIAISS